MGVLAEEHLEDMKGVTEGHGTVKIVQHKGTEAGTGQVENLAVVVELTEELLAGNDEI